MKITNKSKKPLQTLGNKIIFYSNEIKTVLPGETQSIGTGLYIEIPADKILVIVGEDYGEFKSNIMLNTTQTLTSVNPVGTELRIAIKNVSSIAPKYISKGDVLAQGFLLSLPLLQYEETLGTV